MRFGTILGFTTLPGAFFVAGMKTNRRRERAKIRRALIAKSIRPQRERAVASVPCAIYARSAVENPTDDMEKLGVVLQQRHCEAAIWKNRAKGWTHEVTFVDMNRGGNAINDGLRRLTALVKAREIKVVVVYRRDRLARRLELLNYVQTLCERHGVEIYSCSEGDCRNGGPLQAFQAAIQAAAATPA